LVFAGFGFEFGCSRCSGLETGLVAG